ncbi:MAG: hypothetical protein Q9165_005193 [Trypethelium subeluteriae]
MKERLKTPIEQSRLKKQHNAIVSLLHNRATTAPLQHPTTLIDIGCGTGLVTTLLATQHPSAAHIYGIDLVPVPASTAALAATDPRLEFIQGDIRSLLASDPRLRPGSADFAFSRLLLYGMTDWPVYVASLFELVRPGGWAECQEFCDRFFYEAGAYGAGREVGGGDGGGGGGGGGGREGREEGEAVDVLDWEDWAWLRAYREGAAQKGLDLDCGMKVAGWMKDAGFVDVSAREYRMPYWRGAAEERGRPELKGVVELLVGDPDGMFYHAFPKTVEGLGLGREEMEELRRQMMQCLGEEKGKFQTYWVVTGRKPE